MSDSGCQTEATLLANQQQQQPQQQAMHNSSSKGQQQVQEPKFRKSEVPSIPPFRKVLQSTVRLFGSLILPRLLNRTLYVISLSHFTEYSLYRARARRMVRIQMRRAHWSHRLRLSGSWVVRVSR